jgi:hypothetical protein
MPQTPHVEKHFTGSQTIRGIVEKKAWIGTSSWIF